MATVDELFEKYQRSKKGILIPEATTNLNTPKEPINMNVTQSKKYWVWGEIPAEMRPGADTKALEGYYKNCNDLPF